MGVRCGGQSFRIAVRSIRVLPDHIHPVVADLHTGEIGKTLFVFYLYETADSVYIIIHMIKQTADIPIKEFNKGTAEGKPDLHLLLSL